LYLPNGDNMDEGDAVAQAQAVKSCRHPVLVIRGLASAARKNSIAERMVYALVDGQLRTVEAVGHSVMTDNPEAYSAVIQQFLAKL
jgi:pimeloyl-ACP methyl ester carboxylesterase